MSGPQLARAIKHLRAIQKKTDLSLWDQYDPQAHQLPVHADKRKIVTILGGNRSGKSHCAGYTTACHAMGIYPEWWEGLRFHTPVDMGVISISAEQLRKSAQVKMMGEPHAIGTGFINPDMILDKAWRQGTNGCLDWVIVKHASGGSSRIEFMSCEQGQSKFMGFARKWIWFD